MAGVVCPPDAPGKADPLKQAAEARGVPVHQFGSLKTPDARRAFEDARADLAALVYATQIVPEPLLRLPRLTSICFHPSLLPRYRGGSAIAWQLIRGETRTGVTVFWPDAGIDTGPEDVDAGPRLAPDQLPGDRGPASPSSGPTPASTPGRSSCSARPRSIPTTRPGRSTTGRSTRSASRRSSTRWCSSARGGRPGSRRTSPGRATTRSVATSTPPSTGRVRRPRSTT